MERSNRVAVVAHCLLNVNTKVHGLACYPGSHERIRELLDRGCGITQLPCPEFTYLGARRWGMTKEQYDTTGYRRHCRALATGVVEQLIEHRADGTDILEIVGVDGSPSCGVFRTCTGYGGGEIDRLQTKPEATVERGSGVFFEELMTLLSARGLQDVPLSAVPETGGQAGQLAEARAGEAPVPPRAGGN